MKKKDVTSIRHVLPFGNLSASDFERLCYWVVDRSSEFDNAEHYGMTGDKKRDIIAYKHGAKGKIEKWYFNCKRQKKVWPKLFKDELDALKQHSDEKVGFEPDVVVFATSCAVSPKCKDSVKEYGKSLSFEKVYFWADVELDAKAKATEGVVEEFFQGGISSINIAERVAEEISVRFRPMLRQAGDVARRELAAPDEINTEIDQAVQLIDTDRIEEAKGKLYTTLGKIQSEEDRYTSELGRAYNNLGVCFNRLETGGGDYDKADEYFRKALQVDPSLEKATANLSSVYLNRGGKDNFKKAYELADPLWNESDKQEPLFFQVFIWSTHHHFSPKNAIDYYESSEEATSLVNRHERLLNLMGMMYLGVQNFKKAEELVDAALELVPNSPQTLSLKARVLMARSQEEQVIPSFFEVVPKFRDYQGIEKALGLLEQALQVAEADSNRFLMEEIKRDILACSLWLRRAKEARYKDIRRSMDVARLGQKHKLKLTIHDSAAELQARNFESAHTVLVESSFWDKISYDEKARIAAVFFLNGAPEQSKDILKRIEQEAEQKKDVRFWIDMSLCEVLLDNKNLAIRAAQKAKDLSTGTGIDKQALSHFNALMLRYAPSGEVDRLMEAVFEYDKRYPGDKIVTPIKALDETGALTDEVKSIVAKQRNWYEGVRQTFTSECVPSYYLEKVFAKPYAEILSSQSDPMFTIKLMVPDETFEKELRGNLQEAEDVVFDYASLLNLAKMDLLGHLAKLKKNLHVAILLFERIQRELLMFESEDLRRLWHFLRSTREVNIVEQMPVPAKNERVDELFDDWLAASIRLARSKNAALVADDLCLLRYFKSEDIKGTNTPTILRMMLANKWIDPKVYSSSLGDLAERFYTFLSFSGEDLFRIVMEDNSKITLRTYHLVNQLFLPGSIVATFTGVFVTFTGLIWKTGALPEDKVEWLTFLTGRILEYIDRQGGIQSRQELEEVAPDFVRIWAIAVENSNREEILLLDKKVGEVLNKSHLALFKDKIAARIEARKKAFL